MQGFTLHCAYAGRTHAVIGLPQLVPEGYLMLSAANGEAAMAAIAQRAPDFIFWTS